MLRVDTSVLVVEDDLGMATMLTEHLQYRGFEARHCSQAEQALALLQALRFDVVVADVRLGDGLDGLHLCSRIRRHHPDTRVILITAFGDVGMSIAAREAGALELLSKPFPLESLIPLL